MQLFLMGEKTAKMKIKKIIVDKLPKSVTECRFLKVGLFFSKCSVLNKNIHVACFTKRCPLEEDKDMTIKTKFSVGDEVYYIKYKTFEKVCSCCGHEEEDVVAYDVGKGVVAGIKVFIGIDDEGEGVLYKIAIKEYSNVSPLYTNRVESAVYATEKEAEVALRAEVE